MLERNVRRFQRATALSGIIAASFSYVLMFTLLQAVSFDLSVLGEPTELLAIGSEGATVFKWTMIGDIIGQYLLLLPLVLFLGYWLRSRDHLLVTLLTVGGVVYVVVGALGVSINAAVFPELMTQYADAGPDQRAMLETVFTAFANATMVGTWGIFVRLIGGLYWVGIGTVLRHERRYAGFFSVLVGLFALLSAFGNVVQVDPLIGMGTLGYLLGFPAWALWLGLILYRNPQIATEEIHEAGETRVESGS